MQVSVYVWDDCVHLCTQSHRCSHCHKQFAHRGNLMRHLALHDPTNTEYQEAMRRDDASTGDEGEYEGGDEDGTTFFELHNAVSGGDGGVQLTELDGDQMQVGLHDDDYITSCEYSAAVRIFEILNRIEWLLQYGIRLDRNEHNYSKRSNTYCHRFLSYLTE